MINYRLEDREVGTGLSYGAIANDEHARDAVLRACQQLPDGSTVGSVLYCRRHTASFWLLCNGLTHRPRVVT